MARPTRLESGPRLWLRAIVRPFAGGPERRRSAGAALAAGPGPGRPAAGPLAQPAAAAAALAHRPRRRRLCGAGRPRRPGRRRPLRVELVTHRPVLTPRPPPAP